MATSGSSFKIGAATDLTTGSGVFMDGSGNFRVGDAAQGISYTASTNRVLLGSSVDIKGNLLVSLPTYNSYTKILELKFDGNATDTSGYPASFTNNGTVTFAESGFNGVGTGALFNGTTQSLQSGATKLRIGTSFTIYAFVKATNWADNTDRTILGNFQNNTGLRFRKGSTNVLALAVGNGSGSRTVASGDLSTLSSGTYYALAATYNLSTGDMKLYLNGALIGSNTTGAYTISAPTRDMFIGADNNGSNVAELPWAGTIDNLTI